MTGWLRAALGVAVLAVTALASPPCRAGEPKRAVPDYDGRGPEPTSPGDVALWVPRVALFPLYLTSEFVLRRPIGALLVAAERLKLPLWLYDFFAFGPDHKSGFAPIALVDFGFNPSVGVYAFWDDAFAKGNDLRLRGATWGEHWLAGSLTDRIHFGAKDSLALSVTAVRRPDQVFFGVGPSTLQSNLGRYGEDRLEASAALELHLWRASVLQTGMGARTVSLYAGAYGSDPSVEQQAAGGAFALPFGLDRGYTAPFTRLLAALDSREPWPAPGSGVRVEVQAEEGGDASHEPTSSWVRYGATAGGFVDLNDHGRVLSLTIAALFADPLGTAPIPFTELVSLGGDAPMPGFFPGRLLDRSAAVATLQYRWPIAPFLDGAMQLAAGNVTGVHLSELEPRLLRLSGAIGIASVGSPDSSIECKVGFGTETFDHGGQIDTFRLVLGTNRF